MYHFIVGKHQNIILTVGIGHGEGHFVVIVFPEIGIQLHIFQKIMHPTHVPLKAEIQTVLFHRARHFRPGCGFLSDHHRPFISAQHYGIQVLEEFDGLQIFISAVFICHPLSVLFAIIQIKHGGHRIHTQTVHMEMFHPVQSVADEEIFHLVPAVIKNLRSPVRMFSLPGIRMFIDSRAVKHCQAVGIFGEMRRYPV